MQRRLGEIEGATDVMLCRRKIGGEMCVYLTRTDELIVDDFVMPGQEKVVKVADKTRRDMVMAKTRRPSLAARIDGELTNTAARTSLALGVTSAPALVSGD